MLTSLHCRSLQKSFTGHFVRVISHASEIHVHVFNSIYTQTYVAENFGGPANVFAKFAGVNHNYSHVALKEMRLKRQTLTSQQFLFQTAP